MTDVSYGATRVDATLTPQSSANVALPLSVDDALSIIAARRWYFLVPALLGSIAAFVAAGILPPQYKSSAIIAVDGQQIPESLVQTTVTTNAAERIDYITQRILTRSRVLETVRNLNVFPDAELSDSQIVDQFRSDIEVEFVSAQVGQSWSAQTISFMVSFTSSSPDIAQSVANELVTMYLAENVRTRSARAAQTTEFLAEEGDKIREQIKALEAQISDFKQKNSTTMPELMDMNLALMGRYENEHQSVILSLEELEAERKILELQRDQYKNISSGQVADLVQLQRRYADILVQHTPNHPDAVYLEREINRLRAQRNDPEQPDDVRQSELLSDPTFARITTQLDAVDRKSRYLQRSRRELRTKLIEQEERIAKAPAVEQEYTDLQRDLENLVSKYQELKNKEIEAKISQNLEEDQKGERFSLLEAAIVPTSPESPNRLLILLGGMAAALGLGVVAMGLREFLNPGIRSNHTLEKILGTAPLLTVPEFGVSSASSVLFSWKALALLCALAATMAVVAFQFVLSNEGFTFLSGVKLW